MKKTMMIALMVLLACLNLLSGASGSFNANLIPADSKWVIHFDQTTFSKTKLFSILDKTWQNKGEAKGIKAEVFDEMNIDLGKDVKGLTVAGMNRMGKSDNLMVIFQGNFDENLIIKKLKKKEKNYSNKLVVGMNIHCWDGDNFLFFPEKGVFVFCETSKGIEEIVALQTGKAKGMSNSSPLAKLINEAPANAFVRAAVIDISELAKHAPKTMVLDNASMAFFIAMEEKDNLSILLRLATESPKKAQNLEQVITGLKALVSMKAMDKEDEASMWMDLLGSFHVSTQQSNLVMTLDYPVDKIAKLIEDSKNKKHLHNQDKNKQDDDDDEEDEDRP